jgi:NADH pyrophosphatase NudC (nudix superfamily)
MKTIGNKYIDNAEIWSKERTFNERTLALQEMHKIAHKHFPQLKPLILMELQNERAKILGQNSRRKRMSIIGR